MIEFMIPGKPRGKGRPRFSRTGHAYTDEDTREYEKLVKMMCPKEEIFTQPVSVTVTAVMPVPKKTPEAHREQLLYGPYPHKPDCDNVAKIILDALNGVLWQDDAIVCQLKVLKVYGKEPCVWVRVENLAIPGMHMNRC